MRKLVLLAFLTIAYFFGSAAPFRFLPHTITQPDGEVINCYVSGDEYYNWIHDKNGYTIIQASDGYYYYATSQDSKIIASKFKVNKVDPETLGIEKWIQISKSEYQNKKRRYEIPNELKTAGPSKAPLTGTLNNIVIYIRFSDDIEIITTRKAYDDLMNPTSGYSLKSYFTEVSYGNLTINSYHYPTCASPTTTNTSYKDTHPRNYFRPYNETTNTIGYTTDNEARDREHQLLVDAVTWINANSPVDVGINTDGDNDGKVDNVCFMIKGNCDEWTDLLWAHRWVLYSKYIEINGKRVYDYTFQPEDQVDANVLCHEMFHALGAPDLYHYYNGTNLYPVGPWDIMEYGKGHMGAYMKWKYAQGQWINSIPEIKTSGTYTLNPLTSPTNNCYKIASSTSTKEFFVVEYRKKGGTFENYLPGSGLLVYRINTDFEGNADFDNVSEFDEVYLFRPDGTTSANGFINLAFLSSDAGRTAINDRTTNPKSYLSSGSLGGLSIQNITAADATISFDVSVVSSAAGNESILDFKIFPNPSNGLFTLKTDETFNEMNVEVYDITGKKVDMKKFNNSVENTLDLQGYPKGIYFLKIQIDGKAISKKVIID
jgi:M6 family metalloprotease-like protein